MAVNRVNRQFEDEDDGYEKSSVEESSNYGWFWAYTLGAFMLCVMVMSFPYPINFIAICAILVIYGLAIKHPPTPSQT
jgi:hypothetical protein